MIIFNIYFIVFFIIAIFTIILLYKILKSILKFFFLREKMSIKILGNFLNLYKILKKLEKYQNQFINQEKIGSNYYIINQIIYFILSIFSFIIFVIGFFSHLFYLQLYIFVIYRSLNYLYLNYYYFFLEFNFFIKFLILIGFLLYIIFINFILYKKLKKIYIYMYIFYKFFKYKKSINIFAVISNNILLQYFDNNENVKNFISKKIKNIFKSNNTIEYQFIVQSIYTQWEYIYQKSLLLKIISIIHYCIKFLIKCFIYCLLICVIYNLYDLTYTNLLLLLGKIENEINNNSYNFLESILILIKYINLKIILYIYNICIKIYTHTLFLGLPIFIINLLKFIFPNDYSGWFNLENFNFNENLMEEISNLNIFEKFKMLFTNYEVIYLIIIFILAMLISLIILFWILNLILKIFFYIYYQKKFNIKFLILNISPIKLFKYSKFSFYILLKTYKHSYMKKQRISMGFCKFREKNYYSNDNNFDLEFSNILFNVYSLCFLFSIQDYKKFKKLKKIKKLKDISNIIEEYIKKIDNSNFYDIHQDYNDVKYNILLHKSFQ